MAVVLVFLLDVLHGQLDLGVGVAVGDPGKGAVFQPEHRFHSLDIIVDINDQRLIAKIAAEIHMLEQDLVTVPEVDLVWCLVESQIAKVDAGKLKEIPLVSNSALMARFNTDPSSS